MPATSNLGCGQGMSNNITSSGGDTTNTQECKFIVDNQSSNILDTSAPEPSLSNMSHIKMWNYALLLIAQNLVNILIVVGVFIVVMVLLKK